MSNDFIRYDLVVQKALRNAVRDILIDAGRNGLPGDHHFYISYKTGAPGVVLSDRMRKKYPEEITIVLQHQFWDLVVTDKQFEVGLSFGNIPERLVVPFDAITGFIDPSVQFALKFEPEEDAGESAPQEPAAGGNAPVVFAPAGQEGKGAEAVPDGIAPAPATGAGKTGKQVPDAQRPAAGKAGKAETRESEGESTKQDGDEAASGNGDDSAAGNVVSIDAFRKK